MRTILAIIFMTLATHASAETAVYEFKDDTAPTLTTTASAVDRIDYVVRSSSSIHAVATLALS